MARVTSTSSPEWLYNLYSAQVGFHYKTTTCITTYKWEYFQFYLFGTAQLEVKLDKRISFLFGITPRFFFAKNKISEEYDGPEFNYAPLKVNLKAGLQFKLFK